MAPPFSWWAALEALAMSLLPRIEPPWAAEEAYELAEAAAGDAECGVCMEPAADRRRRRHGRPNPLCVAAYPLCAGCAAKVARCPFCQLDFAAAPRPPLAFFPQFNPSPGL